MLADTDKDMQARWDRGYPKHKAHYMGIDQVGFGNYTNKHLFSCIICLQNKYYDDLSTTADIENIRSVMAKLLFDSLRSAFSDLMNFRKNIYRVVDNDTFIKIIPDANANNNEEVK